MDAKWHILYTKEGFEFEVAHFLSNKKLEVFLPVTLAPTNTGTKKIVGRKPLFPSKVFVKVAAEDVLRLRQVPGVISIVYWLAHPAVVPDLEIIAIKKFLKDHPSVGIEKAIVNIRPSKTEVTAYQVRKAVEGTYTVGDTYKIHLPYLGHLLVAKVDKPKLKMINTAPSSEKVAGY